MVSFSTSISCSSDKGLIHRLNDSVDNLLYFGGRKAEVLSISDRVISVKMIDGEKLSWKEIAIKTLLFAFVVIPAVIWKAVYRNHYTFKVMPPIQPVDFTRLTDSCAVMKLQTYSGIHSTKNFFQNEYRNGNTLVSKKMRDLGNQLENDFYIVRARGGGNCFYLSYLCGLLYLVASHDQVREKALKTLENTNLQRIIEVMSNHEDKLHYIRELLANHEMVENLILDLRFFAVDLVNRNIPQANILMYCKESGNTELKNIQNKAEYIQKVKTSEENAQQLEIELLGETLNPIVHCYAKSDSVNPGFYSKADFNGKICILQRDNHYDVLIPKSLASML